MKRGEIWFAATPGGGRPVLVLTRDPVADRIGSVAVAALTRTVRGLVSELELTPDEDGVPSVCVANFDNLHTLPTDAFRRGSPGCRLSGCTTPAAFFWRPPGADAVVPGVVASLPPWRLSTRPSPATSTPAAG